MLVSIILQQISLNHISEYKLFVLSNKSIFYILKMSGSDHFAYSRETMKDQLFNCILQQNHLSFGKSQSNWLDANMDSFWLVLILENHETNTQGDIKCDLDYIKYIYFQQVLSWLVYYWLPRPRIDWIFLDEPINISVFHFQDILVA